MALRGIGKTNNRLFQSKSKATLIKRIQAKENSALKAREKTTKAVETLVMSAVSAGTAFGVSFIDQKQGGLAGWKIVGPLTFPLLVALVGIGAGLSGFAGKGTDYVLAGAYGSLNAWAAHQGRAAATG